MAKRFKSGEWDLIEAELERDPAHYGMPEGGREESVVLASFNIRKLGAPGSRKREIDFMARFCARCDLVAIQEVQDRLDGLHELKARIAHIQIADTPGRHEPGSGEINYPFLFDHLDRLGYDGWVGCEYRPAAGTAEGLGWLAPYL